MEGILMKYFKRFFTLTFFAVLLCLPGQSFADEENPVNPLEKVEPNLDQKLTGDVLAKTYYKNNRQNRTYPNQWKPFVAPLFLNTSTRYPYLQVNVGFGFLYFSGVKGGLTRSDISATIEQETFQGRLAYSRTPLLEMILGYQYNSWFQFGFSYQHQGVIDVQSVPQALPALTGTLFAVNQFKSNLRLDGFALKGYLNTPSGLVMKLISFSAYLGGGLGLSIQSWTAMTVYAFDFVASSLSTAFTDNFTFKNRYCANWFFMADPGFKIQSMVSGRNFSVLLGCKFNYWGQARNMGANKHMLDYVVSGLAHPIGIKSIYQFARYLGFELDF